MARATFVASLLLLAVCVALSEAGTWTTIGSRQYLAEPHQLLTWAQARTECQKLGAELASLTSGSEHNIVHGLANGKRCWIGLYTNTGRYNAQGSQQHRPWYWSDGSSFSYANWWPDEPNDCDFQIHPAGYGYCTPGVSGGEFCVNLYHFSSSDSRWNDSPCHETAGYICEKAATVYPAATPPTVPFATFTQSAAHFPSSVTYTCNNGFEISGTNPISCSIAGSSCVWPAAPQCNRVSCSTPPAKSNAYKSQLTGTEYQDTVRYRCNNGYQGASRVWTCGANKAWSGTAVSCTPVSCGSPPNAANAGVVSNRNTYGGAATYTCHQGFESSDPKQRQCLASAVWSGSSPNCDRVSCGTPPAIASGAAHGTVEAPTRTYQATATYSCNVGYTRSGPSVRTCQHNKQWTQASSATRCTIVSCGSFTVPDGSVQFTSTVFGGSATGSCAEGFERSGGSTVRTCQSNGAWSGSVLECSRVSCGNPATPAHATITQLTSTNYNGRVTFSCSTGYNLVGSATAVCQANEHWSTLPTCHIVTCSALSNPSHGTVQVSGFTFGTVATYECNTGYQISHELPLECMASGSWSRSPPVCNIVVCEEDINAPENGNVEVPDDTHGNVATHTCDTGYMLQGASERVCQADGTWSGSPPTCQPRPCAQLDEATFAHGSITATGHVFGDTAQYSCDTGYTLSGASQRQCLSNQQWDPEEPVCQIVECPSLSAPGNGNVNFASLVYQSVATYSCVTGYELVGTQQRTCQAAGTWTSSVPSCQRRACHGTTESVSNGNVQMVPPSPLGVALFGDEERFSCDPGHVLTGDATRTCTSDGTWSATAASCEPIDCNQPPALENGNVLVSSPKFPSTAEASCSAGYQLEDSNSAQRSCLPTGDWDGVVPKCVGIPCDAVTMPAHGSVVGGEDNIFPTTAVVVCDHGYEPEGQSELTCQTDGSWSSQPACIGIVCTPVSAPSHGTVQVTQDGRFPAIAEYACDQGYRFATGATALRSCLADGSWTGSAPACVPVSCPTPQVQHATVQTTSPVYPSVATVTCLPGYQLEGEADLNCLANGSFGSAPLCVGVPCDTPPATANGSFQVTGTHFPAEAEYSCEDNHFLLGSSELHCLTNGSWGAPPVCEECVSPCTQGKRLSVDCLVATVDDCVLCRDCPTGLTDVGGCVDAQDTLCVDLHGPEITITGEHTVTLEFGATYIEAGATGLDSYEGPVNVTVGGDSVLTRSLGTYYVMYTASDSSGNLAGTRFRTVHIVDRTAPEIILAGDVNTTIEAGREYHDAGAAAVDEADGDLTPMLQIVGLPLDTSQPGLQTVTYTVEDASGNSATEHRRVTVVDETAPSFGSFVGLIEVEGGADFMDPSLSATDIVDGDISWKIQTTTRLNSFGTAKGPGVCDEGSGSHALFSGGVFEVTEPAFAGAVDTSAPVGSRFVLEHTVVDAAGNEATVEQSVVIVDNLSPQLELGALGATVLADYGSAADLARSRLSVVTAFDEHLGDITPVICVAIQVDTSAAAVSPGHDNTVNSTSNVQPPFDILDPWAALGTTYQLTFTVSDSMGQMAQAMRSVILSDLSPPVVTLTGPDRFSVIFGTRFDDPGAEAFDVHDGPVSVTVSGANRIDTRIAGDYFVTYSATDGLAQAGSVQRIVTVDPLEIPGPQFQAVIELAMDLAEWETVKEELLAGVSSALDGAFMFVFSERERVRVGALRRDRRATTTTSIITLGARWSDQPFDWVLAARIIKLFKGKADVPGTTVDDNVIRSYGGGASPTTSASSSSSLTGIIAGATAGIVLIVVALLLIRRRKQRHGPMRSSKFVDPTTPMFSNPMYIDEPHMRPDGTAYTEPFPDNDGANANGMYAEPACYDNDPAVPRVSHYAVPCAGVDGDEGYTEVGVSGESGYVYSESRAPGTGPGGYVEPVVGDAAYAEPGGFYDLARTEGAYAIPMVVEDAYDTATASEAFGPQYDHASGGAAGGAEPRYELASSLDRKPVALYDFAQNAPGNNGSAQPAYVLASTQSAANGGQGLYDMADGKESSQPEYVLASRHSAANGGQGMYDMADGKESGDFAQHKYVLASGGKTNDQPPAATNARTTTPGASGGAPIYELGDAEFGFGFDDTVDQAYDVATEESRASAAGPLYTLGDASGAAPSGAQAKAYDVATEGSVSAAITTSFGGADSHVYTLGNAHDVGDVAAVCSGDFDGDVDLVRMSRAQAEERLKGAPRGTYCLREKDGGGALSVSAGKGRVVHHLLQETSSGITVDGKPVNPKATSLPAAVAALAANPKGLIKIKLTQQLGQTSSI
eukprot:m.230791 g.230791  ORF g.230791 m.230791 type:complete len:2290 (-) comp18860_c1_seq4:608-7477(-)